MAVLRETIALVQSRSTVEIAWIFGLIAAATYHFACQCGEHADLWTSLCTLLAGDILFFYAILMSTEEPTVIGALFGFIIFNSVSVRASLENLSYRSPFLFCLRPCTTSGFDIVEFPLRIFSA